MRLELVKLHLTLAKAILSVAIAFSACVGYILKGHFSYSHFFGVFFGVFFLSASASVLNQYAERKTDALMKRTSKRPLPSGKITVKSALFAALIYAAIGVFILMQFNWVAVLLGLLNLVLYDFVYTPLKYKTTLALLIGGFVGVVPPLIGWFSVGSVGTTAVIIVFSVFMFLWQIPHFLILNYKYSKDYQEAGIFSILDTFDYKQIKILIAIWFVSCSMVSLSFYVFMIAYSSLLILLFSNSFVLILFLLCLLSKKEAIVLKSNILIHVFLLSNFLVLLINPF